MEKEWLKNFNRREKLIHDLMGNAIVRIRGVVLRTNPKTIL